jgi:hypothetical protein
MSNGLIQLNDTDAVFRAMRKMLLEAPAAEVEALAQESGLDTRKLSEIGRSTVKSAIAQHKQNRAKEGSGAILHKGLNSRFPRRRGR